MSHNVSEINVSKINVEKYESQLRHECIGKESDCGVGRYLCLAHARTIHDCACVCRVGDTICTRHAVFDWIGDWYLWLRAGDFSDSHEFFGGQISA